MLRALLSYYAGAFVVQIVTGVLTLLADLWATSALSLEAAGHFRHFSLVYMVFAGPFIVGIDHALVTYINAAAENYVRFLRLFLTYASVLGLVFLGAGLAAIPFVHASTTLGLFAVGPFIVANLGVIVLRAHLDKKREFKLLVVQSLIWSLGTSAMVGFVRESWVPIAWTIVSFVVISCFLLRHFARSVRKAGEPLFVRRPFGVEFAPFWQRFRPLWIAGAAFLANTHVTGVLIDFRLGTDLLAKWGFVGLVMTFMQKPLQLVQRAALPIFSREKGEVFDGFRKLVRLNLIVFPLLSLAVLVGLDLILHFGTLRSKYGDTWPLLAIVIAAAPVTAVEFLVSCVCMAKGHNRNNRDAHVLAAVINVPATAGFIHVFGMIGAAMSASFYVLVFGVAMIWFARRDIPEYVSFAGRQIFVAMPCLVLAIVILGRTEERLLWLPVAAGAYLIGTWLLKLWETWHLRWGIAQMDEYRRSLMNRRGAA